MKRKAGQALCGAQWTVLNHLKQVARVLNRREDAVRYVTTFELKNLDVGKDKYGSHSTEKTSSWDMWTTNRLYKDITNFILQQIDLRASLE